MHTPQKTHRFKEQKEAAFVRPRERGGSVRHSEGGKGEKIRSDSETEEQEYKKANFLEEYSRNCLKGGSVCVQVYSREEHQASGKLFAGF